MQTREGRVMELKDAGLQLRNLAEAWKDPITLPGLEDYNKGCVYCGARLTELLDKCGVPELEDEDE
jgi:hypothetical protein